MSHLEATSTIELPGGVRIPRLGLEAIAGLDSGYRTAPGWDPTHAP